MIFFWAATKKLERRWNIRAHQQEAEQPSRSAPEKKTVMPSQGGLMSKNTS